MKIRRILSFAATLCIAAGTAIPAAYSGITDLPSMTASAAETVTEGDLTFCLCEDHAELYRCSRDAEGDIVIPAEVGGLPVTSIYDSAMKYCEGITSLTIPEGLVTIGASAFYGCNSLSAIELPEELRRICSGAFKGCTGLTELVIPDTVTIIEDEVFSGCTSLVTVGLSQNTVTVDTGVFRNCSALEEIVLPETVNRTGDEVFSGCTSLRKAEFQGDLSSIGLGEGLFMNCTSLERFTVPCNVRNVKNNTFYGCTSLTYIDLCRTTLIGEYAFYGCTSLEAVVLPEVLLSVMEGAFKHCTSLSEVTLPSALQTTAEDAFTDTPRLDSRQKDPDAVVFTGPDEEINGHYVIPEGVTDIAWRAFADCEGLTSLRIPASVTYISDQAFLNCNNLSYVYYEGTLKQWQKLSEQCGKGNKELFIFRSPYCKEADGSFVTADSGNLHFGVYGDHAELITCDSGAEGEIVIPSEINGVPVTVIPEQAFIGRRKVTRVIIPENVKSIGYQAFSDCTSLEDISFPSTLCYLRWGVVDKTPFLNKFREAGELLIINGILCDGRGCKGEVVIPGGVTRINEKAFFDCDDVTMICMPGSVTGIGFDSFCSCRSLVSVRIPDAVKIIDAFAFDQCSELSEL